MDTNGELRERLLDFAVSVIKLGDPAPKTAEAREAIAHLMRSGTTAAIAYCKGELDLARPNHSDGLWRVLGSLREAETLLEKLVQQATAQDGTIGSFEQNTKALRELMEVKIKTAMEELCG